MEREKMYQLKFEILNLLREQSEKVKTDIVTNSSNANGGEWETPSFEEFIKERVRGLSREELVRRVKQMAEKRGFKVKLPYADRIDKNQIRTINFYCQKFRSMLTKQNVPFSPCPFRLTYKSRTAPRE
jgi:hypothetical protein